MVEHTVKALVNRKRAKPHSYEVIKIIAKIFNVKPEYFYDY
jgi:hypothetical protein